jgi:hypothetical protein
MLIASSEPPPVRQPSMDVLTRRRSDRVHTAGTLSIAMARAGRVLFLAIALLTPGAKAVADMVPHLGPHNNNFPFGAAVVLTLIIELAAAAIYLARLKLLGGLVWVLVANLVSLPIVWFVLPSFYFLPGLPLLVSIAAAEVFAVMFEAILLYAAMRKRGLTLGHSVTLSLLMNAASFAVGALSGL